MNDDEQDAAAANYIGEEAVERLAAEIGLNAGDMATIRNLTQRYGADRCITAMNEARECAKGVPSWKYIRRILDRWETDGVSVGAHTAIPDDASRARFEERSARILRGEYD